MPTDDRVNIVLDAHHRKLVATIAKKLGETDGETWSNSRIVRLAIRNMAETLEIETTRKKSPAAR